MTGLCVSRGYVTNLWKVELLQVGRGSNTYFTRSNANQCITFI